MVKTTLFQIAALLGVVTMAACSTGPLQVDECTPDAENPTILHCAQPVAID